VLALADVCQPMPSGDNLAVPHGEPGVSRIVEYRVDLGDRPASRDGIFASLRAGRDTCTLNGRDGGISARWRLILG
jgi:hypothetical protein